ncbi:MAG: hypothetical protein AAGI11_10345 [Pseudomonadota bacterium]
MRSALLVGLAASLISLPSVAESSKQETAKVWEVDTTGRPPYQRQLVEVPVIDVASMETVTASRNAKTTDYTGRPPFRRTQNAGK